MRNKQTLLFGICALILIFSGGRAFAQYSSSSYKVEETFFGTGGELNTSSASYQAKAAAGELGVGNSASTNYQAFAGFNTNDTPYLEFVVTATNTDLGYLDSATTSTTTGSFYVRAWLAGGYVVRTESDTPSNGNHNMSAPSSATASAAGTEQFGINLVANTSPTTFGANVVQSPDSSFSFGQVEPGYNTANLYKYVKSDIVARSLKSSSVSIYTISYIFNISDATPAGKYTINHVLVATATY